MTRVLTAAILVLGTSGMPVGAQTAKDQVIRELTELGYREFSVQRTWLGRVRIVAKGQKGEREVVLNPSTGVVLRDYTDRSETFDAADPQDRQERRRARRRDRNSDVDLDVMTLEDFDEQRHADEGMGFDEDHFDAASDEWSDDGGGWSDDMGPDHDGPDHNGPDHDGPDHDGPGHDDGHGDDGPDHDGPGGGHGSGPSGPGGGH